MIVMKPAAPMDQLDQARQNWLSRHPWSSPSILKVVTVWCGIQARPRHLSTLSVCAHST